MADFSWDYVNRTATEALIGLGRSLVAIIAEAVEPGLYLVEPDVVYEVAECDGVTIARRNGVTIAGPGAAVSDRVLIAIAGEMSGATAKMCVPTPGDLIAAG